VSANGQRIQGNPLARGAACGEHAAVAFEAGTMRIPKDFGF
jgi:hypothetical protein